MMRRTDKTPPARSEESKYVSLTAALALLIALSAIPAIHADPHAEGDLSSYAYVEILEGRGRIEHTWNGTVEELETHYPLLAGDRLTLDPGSRAALILPDRTRLRLAGPADLTLNRLALARDGSSTVSELELRDGEFQLFVGEDFLAEELPIVMTQAGAIFIHEPGEYVFYTDGTWTAATPRSSYAELATERGSAIVRAGETLTIEGTTWPRLSTRVAGAESDLELWAQNLDYERVAYGSPYVDRSLSHTSAPLARHGSWIQVGGRHAWSPNVGRSWRPYYDGRWVPTPSGYTWVSPEPWGWVTYHYGAWDFQTGFGWVWFPGRVYSPAWVYWHWSPSYVGWVPTGYYSSHYGGLHLGVHGWASASWGTYSNWNFCRTRDVGRRDFRSYVTTGHDLSRTARVREVPRGIVTTDTRPIVPRDLESPDELPERIARSRGRAAADLPDVSGFVSRSDDIPGDLARQIRTRVPAPQSKPVGDTSGLASRAPVLRARGTDQGEVAGDPSGRLGVRPARPTDRSGLQHVSPDSDRTRSGVTFSSPQRRQPRSAPRADPQSEPPSGAKTRPQSSRPIGRSYDPRTERGIDPSAGRDAAKPTGPPSTRRAVPGVRVPPAAASPSTPRTLSPGKRVLERIRSHRGSAPQSAPISRSARPSSSPTQDPKSSAPESSAPESSASDRATPAPRATPKSSGSSRPSESRASSRSSSSGSEKSSAKSKDSSSSSSRRSSSARKSRPPKRSSGS